MGMMTVLMQLRKVCNHPDLFEPRSVVTPFTVDRIRVTLPACVIQMTTDKAALERVSSYLTQGLWRGSDGEPSTESALRHDELVSNDLLALEASLSEPLETELSTDEDEGVSHPALLGICKKIAQARFDKRAQDVRFLNAISKSRCHSSPFLYNKNLLDLVSVVKTMHQYQGSDLLTTPSHLLAARRNQLERAKSESSQVKWFAVSVPKASAPAPIAEPMTPPIRVDAFLERKVLEAQQEATKPFCEAEKRLSSFFPDKRLVQFDAGKLQTLANLLRERHAGGHKVLIFTQMSKMLDILEVFLNLNGHSYLRLDGGTSVDRRQRLMDRFNNDAKIFAFILSTRSGGVGVNLTGADSVIFYDSDWNPAQDAQAQDRAHR